ncbi:hypothetical protein Cal7507_0691 [Calothrix sp. PCC 7507]|nr:hypothetical protein Cal7507_0691 [Calothrix sp. PCC 7507]
MFLQIDHSKICSIVLHRNIAIDVKTEAINNYMDNLMRNLNSYDYLLTIYKCNISYYDSLENLNTQFFIRCLIPINILFQQLKIFVLFDYSRYKINFSST